MKYNLKENGTLEIEAEDMEEAYGLGSVSELLPAPYSFSKESGKFIVSIQIDRLVRNLFNGTKWDT